MYPFHVCLKRKRILLSSRLNLSSCLNFVPRSPRKSSTKRKRALPVVSSSKQEFVFSRTCAGKRHLESRERGDRKGANGGKREGERSERESVVPRQNKDSRRDGGHAPPQRHLERSAATMKTRFTGRKQNKRSEFCCLPVL